MKFVVLALILWTGVAQAAIKEKAKKFTDYVSSKAFLTETSLNSIRQQVKNPVVLQLIDKNKKDIKGLIEKHQINPIYDAALKYYQTNLTDAQIDEALKSDLKDPKGKASEYANKAAATLQGDFKKFNEALSINLNKWIEKKLAMAAPKAAAPKAMPPAQTK